MNKRDFIKTGLVSIAGLSVANLKARSINLLPAKSAFSAPRLSYHTNEIQSLASSKSFNKHLKQFEQLNKELISALGNLVFKPKNTKDILQNASMYSKHLVDKACEYYNHKLYFKLIDPSSNPGNAGQFNKAVKKQFGSTMNLLDQLTTMANVNENEGWLWVNIRNEEIQVDFSKTNSNPIIRSNNTNSSSFPLIAIDLSRHAYSDKFRNDRGAYVNAFWNNLNWSFVEKRYLRAGTFSS